VFLSVCTVPILCCRVCVGVLVPLTVSALFRVIAFLATNYRCARVLICLYRARSVLSNLCCGVAPTTVSALFGVIAFLATNYWCACVLVCLYRACSVLSNLCCGVAPTDSVRPLWGDCLLGNKL